MQPRAFAPATERYTGAPDELENQTYCQWVETNLIMTYYQPANVLLIVSLSRRGYIRRFGVAADRPLWRLECPYSSRTKG